MSASEPGPESTSDAVPDAIADARPDAALLMRAMHPDVRFGRDILARDLDLPGRGVLLTQPGPAESLPAAARDRFDRVVMVESLAAERLEALAADLAGFDWVAGVGGGMTMDAAKFSAWRLGLPLVLAPSIISVDASVTNTIAVRRGERIVYEGFVVAERIVADLALIAGAPARLNRAGVGDLLSIHTGLWDWGVGARAGRVGYDEGIAARSRAVLEHLLLAADAVAAVSDEALELILRGYVEVNELCLLAGHSGPEEGSEHYLAYHVEALTGRSFVHGEIIGLGTVLMARLQGNDPGRVIAFLDRCGVAWRPADLGLDRAVLEEALAGLPAFVRRAGLAWSVADEADLGPAAVSGLLDGLDPAG
ncbi:MAG: iron-containing alcohol dehydrogenase [Chloroflexota bacterium]